MFYKILFSAIILSGSISLAIPFSASHYDKDSQKKKLLFTSQRTEKTSDGKTTVDVIFKDPQGQEVVKEKTLLDGDKLSSYNLDQKQVGESGRVEVKGNRVYFTYTKNGKTSKDDEKYQDNLVVGPTLVPFLQKHWEEIQKGKDVSVRFAVPDRKETVGFKLFKVETKKVDGQDALVVKMAPTSIIIRAIVDPLFFTFDQKTGHVIELVGRTLPKIKSGEKWEDLDADTVYTY